MLVRLSSEQLKEYWPMVERALRSSAVALSRMSEERINHVLNHLMRGRAVCWINEKAKNVTTVVITSITKEPLSQTRNLLIYAAHAFMKCSSDEYLEMAGDIGKYAKAEGCDHVLVYSSNDKLTKLLKENGGVENYTLVVFPLM